MYRHNGVNFIVAMRFFHLLPLVFFLRDIVAESSVCDSSATTCSECMNDGLCGWCDGNIYVDQQVFDSRCIDINATFSCDGTFKTDSECDCDVLGAPADLLPLGWMRGLSTDNGDLRERAFKFEKINATLGKVEYIVDGNKFSGTVTSISGCDRSTVSVREATAVY